MHWQGQHLFCNCATPTRAICRTVRRSGRGNNGRRFWGCARYQRKPGPVSVSFSTSTSAANPNVNVSFSKSASDLSASSSFCDLFLWDDEVQQARAEDVDRQAVRLLGMSRQLRSLRLEDAVVLGVGCGDTVMGGGGDASGYGGDNVLSSDEAEAEMVRLADRATWIAGMKRPRSPVAQDSSSDDDESGMDRDAGATSSPTSALPWHRNQRSVRRGKAAAPSSAVTPRKRAAYQGPGDLPTPGRSMPTPRSSKHTGLLVVAEGREPDTPSRSRARGVSDGTRTTTRRNGLISDFFQVLSSKKTPAAAAAAAEKQGSNNIDTIMGIDGDGGDELPPRRAVSFADRLAASSSKPKSTGIPDRATKSFASLPTTKSFRAKASAIDGTTTTRSFSTNANTIVDANTSFAGHRQPRFDPLATSTAHVNGNGNISGIWANTSFGSTQPNTPRPASPPHPKPATSFSATRTMTSNTTSSVRSTLDADFEGQVMGLLATQSIDDDVRRAVSSHLYDYVLQARAALAGRDATRKVLRTRDEHIADLGERLAALESDTMTKDYKIVDLNARLAALETDNKTLRNKLGRKR